MTGERGFALIAVMLVLALLAVVVTELAFSARLEASMVRAYRDGVLARHLAEAGVQQAIREILSQAQVAAVDEDGQLVFYRALPGQTTPTRLPALPRTRVALGAGRVLLPDQRRGGAAQPQRRRPDRLDRLLAALEVEREQRDIIKDSLQDWRDANELHRAHGAESDFYLKLPVPYRARNGNLQDATELLQIRGVTPELYCRRGRPPGARRSGHRVGRSTVNLNTASPLVLKALGLSDAEIADVVQTRVRAPYPSVPGRFAGRGFTVGSSTFRIEAEGWWRAWRAAAWSRWSSAAGRAAPLDVAIVSWRPGDER